MNILQNGEFSAGFYPQRNDDQLQVALNWSAYWVAPRPGSPQWKQQKPTYDSHILDDQPVQRYSTPFATHIAGLWQQVPSAPGNRYELTVQGQAWSSEAEDTGKIHEASDVNLQIGLDPTGGLDPTSPLIEWSDPAEPIGQWITLRLAAQAQSNIITIYLQSAPSLPKRQQTVFWRDALLLPTGRYRRSRTIVGPGDTHINITPEHPDPETAVEIEVSSTRNHPFVDLVVTRPDQHPTTTLFQGIQQADGRTVWQYTFTTAQDGLYDLRFIGDKGARLLAQRLLRVSKQTQIVPSGEPRTAYQRIYVLLPPTATAKWAIAAAQGGFEGRYTVGYSADDAGVGDLETRHVLAVNPHHWPGVLTASWFEQNYPGTKFTPVVTNTPEDLHAWLKSWLTS